MTHYDITMVIYVAKNVLCDIMCHDIAMVTYDITMHTDVARTLIYYVLLLAIMILVFSQ